MTPLRVLVTGGTSGIGGAIAEALARSGAEVWSVGRDAGRGEAWAEALGAQGLAVRFWAADLSTQAGVVGLAQRAQAELNGLDVLVNNVGGVWDRPGLTADGLERTLAVNHVHPFLLTELLFPLLRQRRGKVLFTSTGYHALVRLGRRDWNQERWDSGMNVYGRAKKIALLVHLELAARYAAAGVSLQFADPWMAWTPLTSRMSPDYFPWYGRFLVPAIHAVQRRLSTQWAARSAVDLALDPADRRPGVYAWPWGLRIPLHLGPLGHRRARFLLELSRGAWLTPEARALLDHTPLPEAS